MDPLKLHRVVKTVNGKDFQTLTTRLVNSYKNARTIHRISRNRMLLREVLIKLLIETMKDGEDDDDDDDDDDADGVDGGGRGIAVNVRKDVSVKSDGCAGGYGSDVRRVEHVQAVVTLTSSRRGHVQLYLTSPGATRSTLLAARPGNYNNNNNNKDRN